MTLAIGYVRRSTDKQDLSLEQQRQKLEQFAAARGWQLLRVFEDDAISGSDMKRPGLGQLRAFVKSSPEVVAVIAWGRNRLARAKDPLDAMLLEREILQAGKRVLYAATGQEADRSFVSSLVGLVEHHQSGDYIRKLSRDTLLGIVHRVERGMWPSGPVPYVYDRLILASDGTPKRIVRDMPGRSQLVIDPASLVVLERITGTHRYAEPDHELVRLIPSEPVRVEVVQKLFADYAAGAPVRTLRDGLNRRGLRTARGSIFTPATLHAMLANPAYLGHCFYNRRTESKWHRHTNRQSIERQDEGLEQRPESDWIVTRDAWPAVVDAETFQRVQQRQQGSKEQHTHVTGRAVRGNYYLTGVCRCGVCGGALVGQTCKSGKGYETRYYICGTHHRGDHERCPKRYKIPADLLEQHIVGLIREDLGRLRFDEKLHEYVAEELRRVNGSQADTGEQLQRRLAELDQQMAKLRDHFTKLDPETAQAMGWYEQARRLAEQRKTVESDLAQLPPAVAELPAAAELRKRAETAFDDLETVVGGGTVEEKRELISLHVQNIKADPDTESVQISLYSSLFPRAIAGACSETTHIRAALGAAIRKAYHAAA